MKDHETAQSGFSQWLAGVVNDVGLAWWIEVKTESPRCTYYFGPFLSPTEAEAEKVGYIEDLQQENAEGIVCEIKRCKPKELTIYDENPSVGRSLSGQLR